MHLDCSAQSLILEVNRSIINGLIECDYTVENNTFSENKAYYSGGAILYDLYAPKGLSNNKFNSNYANYGTSVGSYAFRLKFRAST